jgi:two-component system cell cycle sensor histidine kinase/response regulator CckA
MEPTTRHRVLVVDDEESNRTFTARVLREAGYEVMTASDGPEALLFTEQQHPFDLFVIDVLMPQMQGDELGRRLREREPDAKILYLTGYADRLFEQRQVLWENEAFIEKPVTMNGMLEAVSLMLFGNTQGLRRELGYGS